MLLGVVVLLAYRLEFTDTFPVHTQGFFCYDSTYAKPYPGPEAASRAPPALIYALVTAGPTLTVRLGVALIDCGRTSQEARVSGGGWQKAGLEGQEDPVLVSPTDIAGGAGSCLFPHTTLSHPHHRGEHHHFWGLLPLQPPTEEAGPLPR